MNLQISSTAAPPDLHLSLLGRPSITYSGAPLAADLLAKSQALLIYLAVENVPHDRAHLATLLWGDMPDDKAKMNLRTALSRLRKAVGDYVLTQRQSVALDQDRPLFVDVQRFRTGLAATGIAPKRAALELYNGEFLTGFQIPRAEEFEDWARQQRESLHNNAINGLFAVAGDAHQQRELERAVTDYRRLLQLDPWRESAHRALMSLYTELGDRAAALAQYEQCRHYINEELGVSLAVATTELYEKIKRGGIFTTPTETIAPKFTNRRPPNNIPTVPTSFQGRQETRQQILGALQTTDCRLLTITGAGGCGKSRLAIEIGRELLHEAADVATDIGRDGIYWVPLAAVNERVEIVESLVTTLGIAVSQQNPLETQLIEALHNRRLLLILDNCEHLATATTFISDLLHAVGTLTILATSRQRLRLYEEWVVKIDGLPYPPPEQTDIANYDAVQLFVQRARRRNLNFQLNLEAAAVGQLCRQVEGLPLGIELATAWVGAFSCAEIAQQITRIALDLRNVPERHRSLQATFSYSWQLLTPAEQRTLRHIAIFRAPFSLEQATDLLGECRRQIASLVEASLLRRPSTDRYEMHNLLRAFAWEMGSISEQAQAQQRHLQIFTTFLTMRQQALSIGRQQQATVEIRQALPDLRAAWRYAVEQREIAALDQLIDPLALFYLQQGWLHQGFDQFSRATAALKTLLSIAESPTEGHRLWAKLHVYQARCGEFALTDSHEIERLLAKGLALAQQRTDIPAVVAHGLLSHGGIAIRQGQLSAAATHLLQGIDLCRQHQLLDVLAKCLNYYSWIIVTRGDVSLARDLCQEAIDIQEELGDQTGLGATLTTMGIIHTSAGDFEAAEQAYMGSLQHCRAIGHRMGESQALTGLFVSAYRQGKLEKARAYAEQSLQVNDAAGNFLGTAIAHHNMGVLAAEASQHDRAIEHFQQTLQIYSEANVGHQRSDNTRRYLADSYLAQGQLDFASKQLQIVFSHCGSELSAADIAPLFTLLGYLNQIHTQTRLVQLIVNLLRDYPDLNTEQQSQLATFNRTNQAQPLRWPDLVTQIRTYFDAR